MLNKIRGKLKNRSGTSLVTETPIFIIVFAACLALAINLFGVLAYAHSQQTMAKQICRATELTGLESTAWDELDRLNQQLGTDCEMEIIVETIDGNKIQQGEEIEIILSSEKSIRLGGFVDIDIPIKTKSEGHGERWWKGS